MPIAVVEGIRVETSVSIAVDRSDPVELDEKAKKLVVAFQDRKRKDSFGLSSNDSKSVLA
jgi:hypothetical protein